MTKKSHGFFPRYYTWIPNRNWIRKLNDYCALKITSFFSNSCCKTSVIDVIDSYLSFLFCQKYILHHLMQQISCIRFTLYMYTKLLYIIFILAWTNISIEHQIILFKIGNLQYYCTLIFYLKILSCSLQNYKWLHIVAYDSSRSF